MVDVKKKDGEKAKQEKEKKEKRVLREWVADKEEYGALHKVAKQFRMLEGAKILLLFKEKATKRGELTIPSKTYVATDRMNALMYAAALEGMTEESDRKADFLVVIGYDYWQTCNPKGKENVMFRACCAMRYAKDEGPSVVAPDYSIFKAELMRKIETPEIQEVKMIIGEQQRLPFKDAPPRPARPANARKAPAAKAAS